MELKSIIPVVVPEEVLLKIKYLCKNIAKVEWSGVLFYSVEGSIMQPETFKITLEDILPMDMGSQAYTSYELDDRFIDYYTEKPEAMEWTVGHIHSHNTMGVFFSGTDSAELNDNAFSHNYYLSLIVNNYMDMVAKIAMVAKTEKKFTEIPYIAMGEDGVEYTIESVDVNYKKEKLFVYDCEIISEREVIVVDESFGGKVAEIMKPKPKPVTTYKTPHTGANHKAPMSVFTGAGTKGYNPKFTTFPKVDDKQYQGRFKKALKHASTIDTKTFGDTTNIDVLSPYELFIGQLLNFTNPLEPNETVEDILNMLKQSKVQSHYLASSVIENYAPLYDKLFPDADDEEFLEDVESVIEILGDFIMTHPFISVTMQAIEAMATKFEADIK